MLSPTRPLSCHILLLSTSLVTFPLLIYVLACNGLGLGLGLFCHGNDPTFSPLRRPSQKIPFWSVPSEVSPLPTSISLQSPHLLSRKPTWSERSKLLPSFLHPNARSSRFSTRVAEFLHGHRSNSLNSPCKPRFFMTWISSSKEVVFRPRELFAVESLFKSHQNACLLIVSNAMDSAIGDQILRPFSERGFRLAAMSPDFPYIFKNTPAEPWFRRLLQGEIDPGKIPLGQNLSNLLRLAILYKYGGVYIDTDVIVLRSFDGLRNVIGAQSVDPETGNWSRLNNAVMVFDEEHPLLYKFIEEFVRSFDGSKWGHNGPYLVSRVVARIAGKPGFEFRVLPPPAFYPVDWRKIRMLFQAPGNGSHWEWIAKKCDSIRRRSFALHLWNRESRKVEVEEGSFIGRIMSESCLFCNSSVKAV